ncbi:TPA: tRNA (adenine(22)-N(1))-methyltransferase [Streptococcus agalactiae]
MDLQLSKRLQKVANYVPKGARLLDVGSDHAYLPIFLLQMGYCDFAIAGEVVNGPYQSALKNVSEHGLTSKIDVRLANGLSAFEEADNIDTIAICGMGGRLIADILNNDIDKLQHVKTLVLQPNNREDDLRKWLAANDFEIVAEDILTENDKCYEILVVKHGHMNLTAKELRFGPFLLSNNTTVFKEKWQNELNKLTFALNSIPNSKMEERAILEDKIRDIKEVLDES